MSFLSSLVGGSSAQTAPATSEAVMGFPSVAMSQPKPHKAFRDTGFANVLGVLGDALLVNAGRAPMYAPMKAARQEEERRQRTGAALSNYLGQLDPGLRDLIANDPGMGLEIFKMMHPKDDGEPSDIRAARIYGKMAPEERANYERVLKLTHPGMMSPITLGPGDVYEDGSSGSGAPSDVTATGPNGEKIRLNPSTGQWEPVGGSTAPPSGGFQ